jgi:hypothetical protein
MDEIDTALEAGEIPVGLGNRQLLEAVGAFKIAHAQAGAAVAAEYDAPRQAAATAR